MAGTLTLIISARNGDIDYPARKRWLTGAKLLSSVGAARF